MHHPLQLFLCNDPWYVVHCKPAKERYVANSLQQNQGLPVFLPERKVMDQGKVRQIPLFPGYVFVQTDFQKIPSSSINACPGVLRLVAFDGVPQSVPPSIVQALYEEVNRLNASGFLPQFCLGSVVRIKNGPLQDLEAIFMGPTTPSKRVHILLQFLGRLQKLYVNVETLEKVARPVQRQRFSRGKGRKIKHSA